jgi:hypothetical protein
LEIALSTLVRNWISAKHADQEFELKRLAADASNAEQVIRIEGGLPDLPGTSIIMPVPGDLAHSPLHPPAPVVPTTTLQRLEAALHGWSTGDRKGPVEIDPDTWDAMSTIPHDVLQALFDKYGVELPEAVQPADQ